MSADTWLQQLLVDEGHVTETGLTRTPRHRPCRRCGQRTLAAIDDCGFDAITWGWPTTSVGELLAVIAGRHRWHVGFAGGLILRGPQTTKAKPPGVVDVHVEHHCADPPPPPAPSVTPHRTRAPIPDHPPF